jgi:hypothetical protein
MPGVFWHFSRFPRLSTCPAPPPRPLVGELVDHLASPWSGLGVTCHKIAQERRVGPSPPDSAALGSAKRCGHGFSPSPFPRGGRRPGHLSLSGLASTCLRSLARTFGVRPPPRTLGPFLPSPGHGVETPGSVVTVSTVFPTFHRPFPALSLFWAAPFAVSHSQPVFPLPLRGHRTLSAAF